MMVMMTIMMMVVIHTQKVQTETTLEHKFHNCTQYETIDPQ